MADRRRIKLGQLLDIAFESPEVGVVNIRLLAEVLRALLSKLGLKDLDVLVDLDRTGSFHGPPGEEAPNCGEGLLSPSLMALDPEARAVEIGRRRELEVKQVLSLLNAYMVRLQAMEIGLAEMKAQRLEDQEVMTKMRTQIDRIDSRLCDEEKKMSKLEAEMDCLRLTLIDYDIKIQQILRQIDLMGVDLRDTKCQIRCIETERKQYISSVQTITEQINHFAAVKADKFVMEREFALRAKVEDLKMLVSQRCFSEVIMELSSNIAKLYEETFKQEQNLKTQTYELTAGLDTKADTSEIDKLRRQQSKVLVQFRQIQLTAKKKPSSVAAGIVLKPNRSGQCLTCGVNASMEGINQPIPRPVQFVPPSKAKEIFTLRSRYCGGDFTNVRPEEKVVRSNPVIGLHCIGKSVPVPNHIVGGDGSLYWADPCLELPEKNRLFDK